MDRGRDGIPLLKDWCLSVNVFNLQELAAEHSRGHTPAIPVFTEVETKGSGM